MAITPTQGTSSSELSALNEGSTASLTPDELFDYCEGQMNAVDQQAQGYFKQAQTNNQVQTRISDVMSKVKAIQAKMVQAGSSGTDGGQTVIDAENELQDVETTLQNSGDTEDASTVQEALQLLSNGKDTKLSSDEAQKIIETLSSVNSNLGSDNQMSMIHLQSAMSQREQVIQLTTNMLQTLNDSATKVIANIHS